MKGRRDLQHLADPDDIATAKRDGTKVKAACGALVYPMTEMKAEIPTCTPCVTALREQTTRLLAAARAPYITVSSGSWTA